jgi:hypothetical protein
VSSSTSRSKPPKNRRPAAFSPRCDWSSTERRSFFKHALRRVVWFSVWVQRLAGLHAKPYLCNCLGTTRGSRVVVAGSATTSWPKQSGSCKVTVAARGWSARRADGHGAPAACGPQVVCINTAKLTAEAAARVTLQSAAAVWDADWGQVFDITRSASVLARERFQTEPTQYGRFANQAPSKRSFWRSMGSRRLASCSSFVLVLVLETSEHTIEHEDEGRAPRRLAVATGA